MRLGPFCVLQSLPQTRNRVIGHAMPAHRPTPCAQQEEPYWMKEYSSGHQPKSPRRPASRLHAQERPCAKTWDF